eukprot:113990_1
MAAFNYTETYRTTKRKKKEFQSIDNVEATNAISEYIHKEEALDHEPHTLNTEDSNPKAAKMDQTNEKNTSESNQNDHTLEQKDDKLSSSYNKVVRKGGTLRLKFKNRSNQINLLSLKKTIDKKSRHKKLKKLKRKESKNKKRTLKYKTAEELLDERVKKKTDKFAWF